MAAVYMSVNIIQRKQPGVMALGPVNAR